MCNHTFPLDKSSSIKSETDIKPTALQLIISNFLSFCTFCWSGLITCMWLFVLSHLNQFAYWEQLKNIGLERKSFPTRWEKCVDGHKGDIFNICRFVRYLVYISYFISCSFCLNKSHFASFKTFAPILWKNIRLKNKREIAREYFHIGNHIYWYTVPFCFVFPLFLILQICSCTL